MLATVRPRDIAGKTRRRIAAEELAELIAVEAKIKKATAELKAMVLARESRLMDIHGVGPVVAARILADVGDVARFADRNRFASWTGTAPLDASSGEQNRHRLSRAGNRRVNHMIHIAARHPAAVWTPKAAPTTGASEQPERSPKKRSAASSDGSQTSSTGSSSPTPHEPAGRVREGTAGRLKNPARPTFPRTSTLRISHSRTRIPDATPHHPHPEGAALGTPREHRLTTEGSRIDAPPAPPRGPLGVKLFGLGPPRRRGPRGWWRGVVPTASDRVVLGTAPRAGSESRHRVAASRCGPDLVVVAGRTGRRRTASTSARTLDVPRLSLG